MIVAPLELSSRLRAQPRAFDAWFYVNAGLIVLFFALFGSRFVLEPGLGVDFQLPQVAGASAGATSTTCYLSVRRTGQIFTDDGLLNLAQLQQWLQARGKQYRQPSLLIRASAGVPIDRLTEISSLAFQAGFVRVVLGAEEAARPGPGGS